MSEFEQGADTQIIRGHYFDAYITVVDGTRRAFDDAVNANLPLFTGNRRSEIDRLVEQLPGPEQIDDILILLAHLPTGDEHQLREAAGLFERVEAENEEAAGGWGNPGTGGTTRH